MGFIFFSSPSIINWSSIKKTACKLSVCCCAKTLKQSHVPLLPFQVDFFPINLSCIVAVLEWQNYLLIFHEHNNYE